MARFKAERHNNGLYVTLKPGLPEHCVQVTDKVLLDANPDGQAIGVEFLSMNTPFPSFELSQYIRPKNLAQVEALWNEFSGRIKSN